MQETTLISNCISLLDQYKKINFLSLSITILVFAKLLLPQQMPGLAWSGQLLLIAVLLTGVFELVVAMHIGFDRELLRNVYRDNRSISENFRLMDRSLSQLFPRRNFAIHRDTSERIQGCMGLLKKQLMLLVMQIVIVVIYILTQS